MRAHFHFLSGKHARQRQQTAGAHATFDVGSQLDQGAHQNIGDHDVRLESCWQIGWQHDVQARVNAVVHRVLPRDFQRLRIDVNGMRLCGAEFARRDRKDARTATVI